MGRTKAIVEWLDDRAGIRSLARLMLHEEVPGGPRLRYVFGSVLTFLFMQQVVLGILLATVYAPSVGDAWASTAYLQDQAPAGWFLRGLHHHASSMMVVVVVLHLLQVVWAGAYRAPRELNWWAGLAMGGLVLAFALTGYLLPWDQKGYWATKVATGILGTVPGGEPIQSLAQGGSDYGNLTLTRFYALHVFVLPLSLGGLLLAHIALFRRHGITPSPSLPPEELAAKRGWFWPQQLFLDVLAMAFCGALLVGLTTATHGAELYAPADPASNFVARPEWYFLSLFQLLKYFEGSLSIIATVLLPGAAAAFLVALPFVDRATARGGVGRPSGAVMAGVGTLIAGAAVLTALAVVEDANNENFQEAQASARARAERARELARQGVPPGGGLRVWENDPAFKARALFDEHCATCHELDGEGGAEAPSLSAFASEGWLEGAIRQPESPKYFGGTQAHDTMEAYDLEAIPESEMKALLSYLRSLRGDLEPSQLNAELVAKGKTWWDEEGDCSGCHELEVGADGGGTPVLGGRGTEAWVRRVIEDSSAPDLYGEDAAMPKFVGKLAPESIAVLAQLVVRGSESFASD